MAEVVDNPPMTSRLPRWLPVAGILLIAALVDASAPTPSIAVRPDGRLDVSVPPAQAVMRYTLDGTDPTRDAGEWLAPVRVPPGYTVKARAIAADGTPVGDVATWSAPPGGPRPPSTLVPVTQNRDWRVYDWTTRHREASALMRSRRPDIVMLGDSITHFWGGEPVGGRRTGADEWDRFFAGRRVVNLGYGWDRTENVLWRLENGEFEGVTPKVVVLMIGTNNMMLNTSEEIAAGIEAICTSIHQRSPSTKILLLAIFPRGQQPDATRAKVDEVNRRIARLDNRDDVTFLDIGAKFLEPDGSHLARRDVRLPASDREGLRDLVGRDGVHARAAAGWPVSQAGGQVRPGSDSRTGPSASSGPRSRTGRSTWCPRPRLRRR